MLRFNPVLSLMIAAFGGAKLPICAAPPNSASWIDTGSMVAGRALGSSATLLRDGRFLVTGGTVLLPGSIVEQFSTRAEVYDPKTGIWTAVAPMNHSRSEHSTTLLRDGTVLVTGGNSLIFSQLPVFEVLSTVEVFNPATGAWTSRAPMLHPRFGHTATVLNTGKVLVTGGSGDPFGPPPTEAELYDPATGTWSSVGRHLPRSRSTATLLRDGSVLLVGGAPVAEIWDPQSRSWSFAGVPNEIREAATATLLHDGRVLVVGGFGPLGIIASAELFDPRSRTWTPTGSLATRRINHSATLLNNGSVLVTGGLTPVPPPQLSQIVGSSEIYDLHTGAWSPAPGLTTPRFGHLATELRGGGVLVAGGIGGYFTTEIFGGPLH